MRALVLKAQGQIPVIEEVPVPEIGEDEDLVQVRASALNHRDVWITKGKYPGIRYPVILGSDGAGIIKNGKEVVINPGLNWGENKKAQGKAFNILGLPKDGTFADLVAIEKQQLFDKPPHLSFEQAAALPLAGITAYRLLFTKCKAQAGETILITGIGGGVALMCLQFALAIGLNAYVTSSTEEKIEKAIKLGAKGGAIYANTGWHEELVKIAGGGFDLILDSAGGSNFELLLKLCNPGGRIGIYGGTLGPIQNLSPQVIFWRQLSIIGSTMGTNEEFEDMLKFVHNHKIIPVIDSIYEFDDFKDAFERLATGKQFGKVVLRTSLKKM